MPDLRLELPDGDIAPLLAHVGTAVFINISPGVDHDEAPQRSMLGQVFGNSGPVVPLATWTPGEIGIQHAAGQRATRRLGEAGCPVPEEWYVASDHPRRGMVLKTYGADPADELRWLVRASTLLCPLPITGPWVAGVVTR